MSTLLAPLPDHDPLTVAEVAAALGHSHRAVLTAIYRGRFPGAFQTPGGDNGRGGWRIPRAAAEKVGREMGVLR